MRGADAREVAAAEFVQQYQKVFAGKSLLAVASLTGIPEASLRRYSQGLLPRDSRRNSAHNMAILAQFIPQTEALWAAFRAKADPPSGFAVSASFYGVAEQGSNAAGTTVDLIKISMSPSGVTGTITRALPPVDGGSPYSWELLGYNDGARALFLAFRSSDRNGASVGSIVARRASYESPDYIGFSDRYDDETALVRRPYDLVKLLPQHLRPDVALIGLSYTMLRDDLVGVWTESLAADRAWKHDARLKAFRKLLDEQPKAWRSFEVNDRKVFSSTVARFIAGREMQLADMFDRWLLRNLRHYEYPWVRPFLKRLEDLGIAPVAVTALPELLARPLCASLGINEVYALTSDGATVLSDPGDEEGRNNVIDFILGHGRNTLVSLTSEKGDPLGDAFVNLRAGKGDLDAGDSEPGRFNREGKSVEVDSFMETMLPQSRYPRLV